MTLRKMRSTIDPGRKGDKPVSLSEKTVRYLRKECGCSLKGKTAAITGASSGIGLKTAETLIWLGASVIMACRNPGKAEEARRQLLADYPEAKIRILPLDLADFRSIDAFAQQLPDVDIFINNAGVFHRPGEKTPKNPGGAGRVFQIFAACGIIGPYGPLKGCLHQYDLHHP